MNKHKIVPSQYLLPFILTTCCFSLWGFANDFTNPLVKVFEQVFIITTKQASWLQFAFYTGYFCMALPAVLFIRKFTYKAAILLGLGLYATGALLAIPASLNASFVLFCLVSYIITYGLAFLETACNPYILAMGPQETSTQRLNLAQAFNPIGSLIGMFVAANILAPNLEVTQIRTELKEGNSKYIHYLQTEHSLASGSTLDAEKGIVTLQDGAKVSYYNNGIPDFNSESGALDGAIPNVMKAIRSNDPESFHEIQQKDLRNVRVPYLTIAAIVSTFLVLFALCKMPTFKKEEKDAPFKDICLRLLKKSSFREGVLAQLFYVGAQIMCWTFVVHYGMSEVGLSLGEAQKNNIYAMILFLSSRFICTFLLRYISAGKMLATFALGAFLSIVGAIYLEGSSGLYCLVATSGFMSLMFPTIYGISLKNLEIEEAKLGSAFLIMSIVGGAVLTKLQGGLITDYGIKTSFWLPAICFIIIATFGIRTFLVHEKKS